MRQILSRRIWCGAIERLGVLTDEASNANEIVCCARVMAGDEFIEAFLPMCNAP